jgi:hypothetical protein
MVLLAMVASGLPGCAHQAYKATVPDTRLHCVGSLPEVTSRPLNYLAPGEDAEDRRLEFAEVAACVTLAGAALPVASEIDIRVSLSEGGTFAASAELLDAGFQPIKQYRFTDFVRRTNEYSLSVFVDRSRPTPPVYLLLRPDASHVGKQDTTITSQSSAFITPGGGAYRVGTEVSRMRPLLGAGKLQVVAYRARRAAFEEGATPHE